MRLELILAVLTTGFLPLSPNTRAPALPGLVLAQAEAPVLSDEDEAFLKILPTVPGQENADLVPHATPEEAADIAKTFFETPWPSDEELAAIGPFAGTQNVPAQQCSGYAPNAVTEELVLAAPSNERRLKSEIYGLMTVQQVLQTGDCSVVFA